MSSVDNNEPQHTAAVITEQEKSIRLKIGLFGFFLFVIFITGLFWMITTPELTVGLTLSFVAGLSMIFLPCTLPLAFVIVPLTMGKDPKKGLLMALSFTLGLTITLSLYGVFIAAAGKAFGLKSDAEVYAVLLGGFAAFIFGLSEVGLIKFTLPTYSGKFPDFIQRQKDYMKTFLLGLLLGNAGVGCPNPAFYILLGYIATVGDVFNGWFLGFIHGVGRSVPLIFLAILGTLGVNAVSGVARHKEGIQKVMGWMLLIIGAYLLTFGIFGHDWFIASGIHGWWEQFVVNISGERFGETILQHEHKLVNIPNFIQYGNMFFLGLLAITILAAFVFKRATRRTMIWLSVVYVLIALTIGYSTGWTFKVGANMHIQFQGTTATPHDGAGPQHMDEAHSATQYHEQGAIQNGTSVDLNVIPANTIPATDIISGDEAEKLCGPQPPVACGFGAILGCRLADQRWGCYSIPVITASSTRLDFFVNQKPGNIPISTQELEINHTKYMHVIGVRSDLNEFFHLHPDDQFLMHYGADEYKGRWIVEHQFAKPGRYKIWSEIKKDGISHAFGHPEILVAGYGLTEEKKVFFGRNVVVGQYQVALKLDEPVVQGHVHDLSFNVHAYNGDKIEIEEYLAAKMHLTIIKDDWKQFIHTHPEQGDHHSAHLIPEAHAHGGEEVLGAVRNEGEDETVNFHTIFSEAGLYKIFVQFRPTGIGLPQDEALTASFWIRVEQKASFAVSWWMLLAVSLVLIVLLCFGVRRYLQVGQKNQ